MASTDEFDLAHTHFRFLRETSSAKAALFSLGDSEMMITTLMFEAANARLVAQHARGLATSAVDKTLAQGLRDYAAALESRASTLDRAVQKTLEDSGQAHIYRQERAA